MVKNLANGLLQKIMILYQDSSYGLVLIFLAKQGDGPPMARKQDFWMLPALRSPAFISERVYGRIDLW